MTDGSRVVFHPHYLDSPRQTALRYLRTSDALKMTDALPPSPKLFTHSCAISKSSKLELLESLSEFGRVIVLIAQIGTDAACCLGRSYAGGVCTNRYSPTASTRFSSMILQHICFGICIGLVLQSHWCTMGNRCLRCALVQRPRVCVALPSPPDASIKCRSVTLR